MRVGLRINNAALNFSKCQGSNENFKEIMAALSTLISKYITHCLTVTEPLQKLTKEFYFYIIYTKRNKFQDFPGNEALSVKQWQFLDIPKNVYSNLNFRK